MYARDPVEKALIVLLDDSGSMDEIMDGTSKERKIEVAWRVLREKLAPNISGWTYGLLLFEGESAWWEIYPMEDTQALVALQKPCAGGSTPMAKALRLVWGWTRSYAKQARFILLSDGCPTDASTEEILRTAGEYKYIPIDTVGIGTLTGMSYNEVFLRELSRITGGIFSRAHTVELLANTILELSPERRPLLGSAKKG